MTDRALQEYRELRATIRERGTARTWIVVVGLSVWGALSVAAAALTLPPAMLLVPLVVLAGAFEAIFALHTGVERVGRYLQVFHEAESDAALWESTAMAFRPAPSSAAIDPLFTRLFAIATVLNLIPAVTFGVVSIEWAVLAAAHALVVVRLIVAKRQAAGQRASDLDVFQKLKASGTARS